jgi:hypothetical protein
MRRLTMAGLVFAVPSLAMAAGSHGVHTSAPTARAAPTVRSAPIMRSAPTYHPTIHQTPHARSFTPGHTFQHTRQTVFHPGGSHIFANPDRREVTRHVRFHGRLLALPALVTLGAPVFLDVPGIGAVSVPEETYTSLYPMLSSDDEAERERAYRQLQEQVEHQPESLIHAPTAAPSATFYSRGLAALDRGDFDVAIVELTVAIGDDPTDTFAYLKRATAYEKKGDRASAISDYREALKLVDGETRGEINATIRRLAGKP